MPRAAAHNATTIAGAYGCGIVGEVAVLEERIAVAKRTIAECPAKKAAVLRHWL